MNSSVKTMKLANFIKNKNAPPSMKLKDFVHIKKDGVVYLQNGKVQQVRSISVPTHILKQTSNMNKIFGKVGKKTRRNRRVSTRRNRRVSTRRH